MQEWRHDIHRHPELGFEEHRTSDIVATLLSEFGVGVHREIGGTGVVGVLQLGDSDKSIGLRADMDAGWADEIDIFEGQVELRKQSKIVSTNNTLDTMPSRRPSCSMASNPSTTITGSPAISQPKNAAVPMARTAEPGSEKATGNPDPRAQIIRTISSRT